MNKAKPALNLPLTARISGAVALGLQEYEQHIKAGTLVWAGVDYEAILRRAEDECDVIIWDGGNNDTVRGSGGWAEGKGRKRSAGGVFSCLY